MVVSQAEPRSSVVFGVSRAVSSLTGRQQAAGRVSRPQRAAEGAILRSAGQQWCPKDAGHQPLIGIWGDNTLTGCGGLGRVWLDQRNHVMVLVRRRV